ncbi:MAG: hypothetical protein M1813_007183 [Trichoglossum hirsutum]|nr:MAG: hypothetical protein M1813_007183 [Trichoglossum hirsutum]
MSIKEWIRLRNDLNISETDEKFPKYSYNSSISTLIVQFMPLPVHESITSIFTRGFNAAQESLPYPLRTRITAVTNQEFDGFGGQYSGSNKTPDLAVEFKNSKGDLEPKFVLEVGFSETYDELFQDARMWLEGRNDVSILVLAKFEETPKYQCPVRQFNNEGFEQLGFSEATKLRTSHFNLEDEYGLAIYKGFTWVGQISASLEIWKKDPITGLATRNGSRINLLTAATPPQVEFQLSDFLDIDPENERTIPFQWGDYRPLIKDKIRALAMFRCQKMLKDRARLEDIRDLDYIPSDSS